MISQLEKAIIQYEKHHTFKHESRHDRSKVNKPLREMLEFFRQRESKNDTKLDPNTKVEQST